MQKKREPRAPAFSRARFARIYYIHNQLYSGKYPNVPVLARELEVSSRTVERDIEHMRDMLGAPVEYDYLKKGYYYSKADFQLPPMRLTEGELVALFLGQKLLAQCAGTPLEEYVRSAFEKIVTVMPEGISVDWMTLEHAISFDLEPLRGDERQVADMYRRLAAAVENKITVWVKYYSASRDDTSERYIDPYHLRYYQGAWYIIAYCHLRKAVRIFALDRIWEMTETTRGFTVMPGFSLEDYLCSALGIELGGKPYEVVIHFDRHQARWIRERCWHHTQKIEYQPDGSLILTMTVGGLGEVKRWVMGFGSRARVIRPEVLREEVAREARKLAEIYG